MTQILKSGTVPLYGAFVAAATVLLILYAFYYTSKRKYENSTLMYITPAAIFLGFAGARLMYVTVCDQLYIEPADKWKLTDGGYALYGAAAGVILTVVIWWLITKRRFSPLKVFDAICISAPLAIALGRMGSIFSGDCLGEVVEAEGLRFFPVAIYKASDSSYHYAVFFYEAVFCLLIFFFIRYADKKANCPGTSTYLFTVLYSSGRSFFEGLREDSMYLGFVRINQAISILAVLGAFAFLSVILFKKTGFRWKYIISYGIVTVSFAAAFFAVFYMYSSSAAWNTVQIMICCAVIAVTSSYTGLLYALEMEKSKKAAKKAVRKKPLPDKTQRFSSIKTEKK